MSKKCTGCGYNVEVCALCDVEYKQEEMDIFQSKFICKDCIREFKDFSKMYRIKASKESRLYFSGFDETVVHFELNELGFEKYIQTFDNIGDAMAIADIFDGYVEEF